MGKPMDFETQTVAIGHPIIGGNPTWGLYRTMMALERPQGPLAITREAGLPVDEARNELMRWFVEDTDCGWLLMADHDAVLHPQTLRRLMSWDQPIVSGLAFIRHTPIMPALATRGDDGNWHFAVERVSAWVTEQKLWRARSGGMVLDPAPDDSLYSLSEPPGYAGCHCLLIRRDAAEKMSRPWFKRINKCVGEDRYFYAKAYAEKIPAFVDLSCLVGHLYSSDMMLGVVDYLAWQALIEKTGRHWEEMVHLE